MAEVKITREFPHSAEKVWAVLANFGDISWAPGIEKVEVIGEGPGMTRRIFMPEMDPIDEVMDSIDHSAMTLRYTIPRGNPLPITDYLAGPQVVAIGDNQCRVEWIGQFQPAGISEAEASEAVGGIYTMMLQWLDESLA